MNSTPEPTPKPRDARRSFRADGPDGSFFQTTTKIHAKSLSHVVVAHRARTGEWADIAWCESEGEAAARVNIAGASGQYDNVQVIPATETACLVTYVTTAFIFGERRHRQGVSTPLPTCALGIRSSRGTDLAERAVAQWRMHFPEAVDAELVIAPATTHVQGSRR